MTYLDGLAGDGIDGTCRPDLELVEDHVAQALVVDDADVDVRRELLPGDPGVHRLVPIVVVPGSEQLLAKVVDGGVFFGEPVIVKTCNSYGTEKRQDGEKGEDDRQGRTRQSRFWVCGLRGDGDLLEGRRVLREAVHRAGLAGHALHQHANRHAGRERVRVDDDVGLHPALRERHVDGGPLLRADAFLPVPRRELVANHGCAGDAQGDVDLLQFLIARIAP